MRLIRVAAYCRVSTKKEEQEKSLESQQRFFTEIINKNLAWHFYGIYSDEESGTSTKKRKGFLQMMHDAREYKFDLILTKEISRFARNVQDSIKYTEELKRLDIEVRFLTDNINSFDSDHELRFNLMSSIYQDESRRTSQRVRWGHQRQMENGVVFGASIYGYHLKGGKLTLNLDEARIIRLIFSLYLDEGMGVHRIVNHLASQGIPSPSGAPTWKNASVLRMLKNEKYMGMLKQKKQITVDYKTHERKINHGEEDFIIIENNHEAIVSPEIWHRAQKEMANRRTKILSKTNHSNRYWLSGKIQCEHCHFTYKRKINNGKSKYRQVLWMCGKIDCNNQSIHERVLQEAFMDVLKNHIDNKTELISNIKNILYHVLSNTDDNTAEMHRIEREICRRENRISKLIELFLDGGIDRVNYDLKRDSLTKQINTLQGEFQTYAQIDEERQTMTDKLEEISLIIESILNFKVFSEELGKSLLHKVTVQSREQITYYINNDDGSNFFTSF
ncbi:MAG: recombinase family protein [Defluviitaleaceae bacterium]|nr:recombinase family protein [Defluviitaleaceae bacterium]